MMIGRLLSAPRSIARDLVDKRLWPVALALLVALVAVPVVIGRSGADAPVAPAAVPATAAQPGADAAIEVAAPSLPQRSRTGAVNDPFYDPPKPKTASRATTTTSSSTSSSSSSSRSTAPATPRTPSAATPATQAPKTAAATTAGSFYRARVRFGADDSAAVRGLSRLQPLGGRANPAALYLGPTVDHRHAVFLLGPGAVVADGDAACGEKTCRVIALKAGQSITIDVAAGSGQAAQRFVLAVHGLAKHDVAGKAALLKLRDRVHADGRDVLRTVIKDQATAAAVGRLSYDRSRGAVVKVASL
jgi:hypothetical protein